MTCDEALAKLRALEPELRAKGVGALYLFGSTVRDEARTDSDVDVMFEDAPGRVLSLFAMAGVKLFLADSLGVPVDLTDRRTVHFMLRDQIEAEAVRVFA